MPEPVYLPVLKGRQGELTSLADIRPVTRRAIVPLVEIVPGPLDDEPTVRAVVDKTIRKLKVWSGSRLLLDTGWLPGDIQLPGGVDVLGYATAAAAAAGIEATPVVRLNGAELARRGARRHTESEDGIAVRLNVEDMDEDPEDLEEALTALLRRLGRTPAEVDLLLDLGPVDGDVAARAGARLVRDVLHDLPEPEAWRGVVVLAGAFPADLQAVQPWTLGELPRRDATLHDRLRRRPLPRVPTFGDYAVTHPLLVTGPAFPAAPQLHYTASDQWLVLKGRRNDPEGHEQFYRVCEAIAQHPEFAGAALGKADARIADPRRNGPGNASTWRAIATTHHLDYLVHRLTTLGEP
ncbi:MAG: beta family protein [Pseudonocardiaceae bacterium]